MTIMYLLLCFDILAAMMHIVLYNLYVCKLCFDNKLLLLLLLLTISCDLHREESAEILQNRMQLDKILSPSPTKPNIFR